MLRTILPQKYPQSMTSQHNFQVNLRGVISLLSDHLYSGPQVYIRELLQNSVDAITARKQVEPDHSGAISLEIVRPSEDQPATMIATDNGIGLTEDEVHQFLATIGQSSKRENLERRNFIGQFGIGLLSGFVVCEEIVVITRSIKADSQTVEWKGRSDGTYSVRIIESDFEPGTQVFLRAKPGCHDFFDPKFVTETAEYFGKHLPHPIEMIVGEEKSTINEQFPWDVEYESEAARHEAIMAYGRDTFETDFLDAIPLKSPSGKVSGMAYVLPFAASIAAKQSHRVYLKNMLLSESIENLMPDWAFFVKCVVNADNLRPTAARESFYEDMNLAETQSELGGCLRQYLLTLAESDRQRLDRIIALHYLPIKALASEDDDFYRIFIYWLPFETSMGTMTLSEYREITSTVHFVPTREQFRQISGVASAQQICVINACYTYEQDLLNKLPMVDSEIELVQLDVNDLAQQFEELTQKELDEVAELVDLADMVLQPFKCRVEFKKFEPAHLPSLYTTNETATFLRSIEQTQEVSDELWSGILGNLADGAKDKSLAQLCLNYNNSLLKKLTGVKNKNLVGQSIRMLYVQALLMGHYPLRANEMGLLSDGLIGLIENNIDRESQD